MIEGCYEISYRGRLMETWRLLDTGARSGAENMALDETLLELKAAGRPPLPYVFSSFLLQLLRND